MLDQVHGPATAYRGWVLREPAHDHRGREPRPLTARGERRQPAGDPGEGIIRNYVTREITSFPPVVEGAPYSRHGDPGLKKDAFAICLCHTLPDIKAVNEAKGGNTEIQKVAVDFVLSSDPRPGQPVDLLQVDEVIETIAKMYNVRRVTFDRWNSAQSIRKLVAMGIDADDVNFSNADQMAMYRYQGPWQRGLHGHLGVGRNLVEWLSDPWF